MHEGIGATIRVSLTADPCEEIKAGFAILNAVGVRKYGPELISCPTCGRTEIDLIGLAQKVEKVLLGIKKPLKVAVMGCVVNGPGEAREADIGIAGGKIYFEKANEKWSLNSLAIDKIFRGVGDFLKIHSPILM